MTRTARLLIIAVLASLSVVVAPGSASADLLSTTTSTVTSTTTSTLLDWSGLLPSLADPYNADDPNNICNSGKPQCVDAVAREMSKRLQPLSDSCSHNAVFALLYLDVTYHIGDAVRTDGYFQVPGVISHEDALFASYYFNAFDNYAAGNYSAVPQA